MKKRVLLVNKFYYSRGGAEVVVLNLEEELKRRGYEVAVFSMSYNNNESNNNLYVAPNVDFKGSIFNKVKFALRTLGYYGVNKSFNDVMRKFKPHIVHLHNIHSYLSPSIIKIAHAQGCKVIWTLHDYKLICPAYSCLNHGKICELCFNNKCHILRESCMKDNLPASIIAYLEALKWNKDYLQKHTDVFICPSQFMQNQMKKGNFDSKKLRVICNFIDPIKADELKSKSCVNKENYYIYVGRLSEEKGVETLLSAASKLPYELRIAGTGPLAIKLKEKYNKYDNIKFLGHLNAVEVTDLLIKARALISPSECYENNPLSVIEGLCAGVPVIGANIGGIPELINDDNGMIFTSGNVLELMEAITNVMASTYDYNTILTNARVKFSASKHFEELEKIYLDQ